MAERFSAAAPMTGAAADLRGFIPRTAPTGWSGLGQVGNCSGQVRVVDELKLAVAAFPARRGEGRIGWIRSEGFRVLGGRKRHDRDQRSVRGGAFQCLYIAAARQVLAAMLVNDLVHRSGIFRYPFAVGHLDVCD